MEDLKYKIAKSFSRSAKFYDEHSLIQTKSSVDLVKFLDKSADISQVSTCLDIGAGTGNTSLLLKRLFPNIKFTLCDISPAMLAISKEKFPTCETLNVDAESYNFNKYYDVCISNLSIQWFENLEKFLINITKICNLFAFSILLDTSFIEYKKLFKMPPTFDYPSYDDIIFFVKQFKYFKYFTKKYCINYNNALDVARHFKNIGAGITSDEGKNREEIINVLRSNSSCIKLNYDMFFGLISIKDI